MLENVRANVLKKIQIKIAIINKIAIFREEATSGLVVGMMQYFRAKVYFFDCLALDEVQIKRFNEAEKTTR